MHGLALTRRAEHFDCSRSNRPLIVVTGPVDNRDAEYLIRAIANSGDRAAFATLFTRFAPRVKAYLMRLGLDNAPAEEATQEVLLTIWRKAGQFDPTRATAAAWVFTITRNIRIDMARRRQPMPHPDPSDEPVIEPTAEAVLAAADRSDRVALALAMLPAEQAEVIRLAFFNDRPHAEIEHALGVPLGTVKSRLRLAMAKLRGLLDNDL